MNAASREVWAIYQGALNDYLATGKQYGWMSLETQSKQSHAKLVLERFYALEGKWS